MTHNCWCAFKITQPCALNFTQKRNKAWRERKYLDMDEFTKWLAARKTPDDGGGDCCQRLILSIKKLANRENNLQARKLSNSIFFNGFLRV